ncbi:signal peptidase I [Corynebacterium pacaense]|uniref:signal peptidase I n=1 Tax=Corynebacterium pacaense TaxID=1816684 RepID=UPI0009BBA9F9|nr:signal peptidase I [Corynebacterium pacaense]
MTDSSSASESTPENSGRNGDVGKKKAARQTPWYIEIPVVVVLTLLVVFLLQTFVGRLYMIPSGSMEPTLHGCEGCTGDRILVEKVSYYFEDPEPGDVVVFEGTDSWNVNFTTQRSDNTVIRGLQNLGSYVGLVAPDENDLVKRIIATGGQTVSCQEGDPGVMVDGSVVDSSFTLQPAQYPIDPRSGSEACGGEFFGPITVPEANFFMMGDNRTNSADSRYHLGDQYQGTIPEDNIKGKVRAVVLPLSRIGGVSDPDIQE